VLAKGIRYNRPIVATRHDALIDYLGEDYPGFVPANDPDAMRASIVRALSDQRFRASLLERIEVSAQMLRKMGDLEAEILAILTPGDAPE
jgi:glycosyltransferase involved in cell wall biosynthesis